jgi:hypothetical protein
MYEICKIEWGIALLVEGADSAAMWGHRWARVCKQAAHLWPEKGFPGRVRFLKQTLVDMAGLCMQGSLCKQTQTLHKRRWEQVEKTIVSPAKRCTSCTETLQTGRGFMAYIGSADRQALLTMTTFPDRDRSAE